jgi:hypothetical protein
MLTNKKRCQQAHIQLSFNPEMHVFIDNSEFWLEPAENFVNDKVVKKHKDVSSKKLLREKRKGYPKHLNHWRFLV